MEDPKRPKTTPMELIQEKKKQHQLLKINKNIKLCIKTSNHHMWSFTTNNKNNYKKKKMRILR